MLVPLLTRPHLVTLALFTLLPSSCHPSSPTALQHVGSQVGPSSPSEGVTLSTRGGIALDCGSAASGGVGRRTAAQASPSPSLQTMVGQHSGHRVVSAAVAPWVAGSLWQWVTRPWMTPGGPGYVGTRAIADPYLFTIAASFDCSCYSCHC